MSKKCSHTVIKWYPGEGELSYSHHSTAVQKEFEENPDRILRNRATVATRRLTPRMTDLGKESYEQILAVLWTGGHRNLSHRWDKNCGCRCSCSPGYRIYSPTEAELRNVHSANGEIISIEFEGR